jgi:hypothetical protein
MALARIITRSDQCSRELARDLLARGYSVEIVSPDKIPDKIADLELRVYAGPGDRLTATVEAHHGERSTSFEFVHYLKASPVDFIRRPTETPEVVHLPVQRVGAHAEPHIEIEAVVLPAKAPQPTPEVVLPAARVRLVGELDGEEGARLIPAASPTVPHDPAPTPPLEPPSYFAVEEPEIVRPEIVRPEIARPEIVRPANAPPTVPASMRSPRRRDRSMEWGWRAALAFASMLLLAVVVVFGMRRSGQTAAKSSALTPIEMVAAASPEMNLLSAADSEKDAGRSVSKPPVLAPPPAAAKLEGNAGHTPKATPAPKAAATTASRQLRTPPPRSDDVIARNTVTYLDKRFEPPGLNKSAPKAALAKRPARRSPSLRKHGGVIAANEMTYLHKPSPKATK